MSELLPCPFPAKLEWYWRVGDDGYPDCGILFQPIPGHAYAVARCPKYLDQKTWEEYASFICRSVNTRPTPDTILMKRGDLIRVQKTLEQFKLTLEEAANDYETMAVSFKSHGLMSSHREAVETGAYIRAILKSREHIYPILEAALGKG